MSNAFESWISQNTDTPGVLAFGIYVQGKMNFVQSCSANLESQSLENAWRCVAETIPVLQLNRFPTARFRFVYGEGVVHCERRKDGTCLGIFARRDEGNFRASNWTAS